jgi:HSP20 family molecular chaperone IbpA
MGLAPRTIPVEESVEPGRYRLRAELPGIDIRDARVTYEGCELRLDATRTPSPHALRERSEFWYGRRLRIVPLPHDLRSCTLTARYSHGVLEVTADRGQAEPRRAAFRIEVVAAA